MPTPIACYWRKTISSMLILYHGGFGLIPSSTSFIDDPEGWKFATWNSSIIDLALWIIILADWSAFPCQTWFQLNQMFQAIVMTNSKISLPTCCTNFKCHKRSTNSLKCTPLESWVNQNSRGCLYFSSFVTFPKIGAHCFLLPFHKPYMLDCLRLSDDKGWL